MFMVFGSRYETKHTAHTNTRTEHNTTQAKWLGQPNNKESVPKICPSCLLSVLLSLLLYCLRTRSSAAMDVVCGLTAFMVRQDCEQYPASKYPVSSAEGSSR